MLVVFAFAHLANGQTEYVVTKQMKVLLSLTLQLSLLVCEKIIFQTFIDGIKTAINEQGAIKSKGQNIDKALMKLFLKMETDLDAAVLEWKKIKMSESSM